jgi:hypothetical protein
VVKESKSIKNYSRIQQYPIEVKPSIVPHIERYNCKVLFETPCITIESHIEP